MVHSDAAPDNEPRIDPLIASILHPIHIAVRWEDAEGFAVVAHSGFLKHDMIPSITPRGLFGAALRRDTFVSKIYRMPGTSTLVVGSSAGDFLFANFFFSQ